MNKKRTLSVIALAVLIAASVCIASLYIGCCIGNLYHSIRAARQTPCRLAFSAYSAPAETARFDEKA